MKLILASSSKYRKSLLQQLGLAFECIPPGIDESRLPGESPLQMVERLAIAKADAVAADHPDSVIIASDQVVVLGQEILGKPGNRVRAMEQLQALSGNEVDFLTGVCTYDRDYGHDSAVVPVRVSFRRLDTAAIGRYLDRDEPWDCAGSFRSEGLGICLVNRIATGDSSALVGLPLIKTAEMLRNRGYKLP